MTKREAKARVRRGAALLDAKVPEWRNQILPFLLDVGRFDKCPLAQVSPEGLYAKGRELVGLWGPVQVDGVGVITRQRPFMPRPEDLGFLGDYADQQALNAAWLDNIYGVQA